jgi:hypothetical protein
MLTITIPTPGDEAVFLDIDVTYDVIATSGPPEPPLDTVLTGWSFVECWRLDPDAESGMSVVELANALGELPPRYIQYLDKYVGDNFLVIQKNCRDFELTRSDCVV